MRFFSLSSFFARLAPRGLGPRKSRGGAWAFVALIMLFLVIGMIYPVMERIFNEVDAHIIQDPSWWPNGSAPGWLVDVRDFAHVLLVDFPGYAVLTVFLAIMAGIFVNEVAKQ